MIITYDCQCPELRRKCPACIAYDLEQKPWLTETLAAVPMGCTAVLPPSLVAAHEALGAQVAVGESYTALAQRYGVSESSLRRYLETTGLHVPRMALKAAQLQALAPRVLAAVAAGQSRCAVAREYGISPHAIRSMQQRAAAGQRTQEGSDGHLCRR